MIHVPSCFRDRFFRHFGSAVLAAAAMACATASDITVTTTIQAAVDAARAGDTVHVPAGVYRENVHVSKDGITIEGVAGAILDGSGLAGNTGINVAPIAPSTGIAGFKLLRIQIRNYSQNGVRLERVRGFQLREGIYTNNSQYGVFPVLSSDGTIELNAVSGANDTGIYVGQSTDVVVRANVSSKCAIGYEVENSARVRVEGNLASGNSTGILVDVLPGLVVKSTSDVRVTSNLVIGNNRPNPVTDPTEILSLLPSGAGILNVGGDKIVIANNEVFNNKTVGIGVIQLPPATAHLDPGISGVPDNNQVRNNIALQNGSNPDPKSAPAPGSDLGWDGSGAGNCWTRNLFRSSFPAHLPACAQ